MAAWEIPGNGGLQFTKCGTFQQTLFDYQKVLRIAAAMDFQRLSRFIIV